MGGGKFDLSGLSKSTFSSLSSNRPVRHSSNTVSVMINRLAAKEVKSDE
jgi:hypothetical protein